MNTKFDTMMAEYQAVIFGETHWNIHDALDWYHMLNDYCEGENW